MDVDERGAILNGRQNSDATPQGKTLYSMGATELHASAKALTSPRLNQLQAQLITRLAGRDVSVHTSAVGLLYGRKNCWLTS
jgi:hypothetical protein